MVDREKVLTVLRKRFPGSSSAQLAAAANAIVGLEDEWEEIGRREAGGREATDLVGFERCVLVRALGLAAEIKLFRRRNSDSGELPDPDARSEDPPIPRRRG